MEGHCSTGQSPQWAVVPMEEEEEEQQQQQQPQQHQQHMHEYESRAFLCLRRLSDSEYW